MTEAQRIEEKQEVDNSLNVAFDLLLTLQHAREAESVRERVGEGVEQGSYQEGRGGTTTKTTVPSTTTGEGADAGEGTGAWKGAVVEELGYETVRMLLVELAESHRVIETGPGGVDGPAFAELETLLFSILDRSGDRLIQRAEWTQLCRVLHLRFKRIPPRTFMEVWSGSGSCSGFWSGSGCRSRSGTRSECCTYSLANSLNVEPSTHPLAHSFAHSLSSLIGVVASHGQDQRVRMAGTSGQELIVRGYGGLCAGGERCDGGLPGRALGGRSLKIQRWYVTFDIYLNVVL